MRYGLIEEAHGSSVVVLSGGLAATGGTGLALVERVGGGVRVRRLLCNLIGDV